MKLLKPAPYPYDFFNSKDFPVVLGIDNGGADQRVMQICNCYIGMFKIPHTSKIEFKIKKC